ncbi:MAG: hypothetical protein B6I38_03430 [Anaerolineaceae bacterium 4572_5.1]|nr:MAG: hypothetical protein B6I38_03430 [Anaerolineaceae bacterium 4572_5.1]
MPVQNTPLSFWQKLRFRNWKIFIKFMVVLLVLAVVPLLIVTFSSSREASNALVDREKINISRLAYSTAQRIEQLLGDNHNVISMLANDRDVITYISQYREGAVQIQNQVDINYTILNARDSHDTIELVSVFDAEGWAIAHTKEYIVGSQWDFRKYFQQAIQGNKYLSGILIGGKDDTPGIFGSAPVYSQDHSEIIGVLSTKIRGDYITDILVNTLSSEEGMLSGNEFLEGEVYLINEYGMVMAHSDTDSDWLYRSLGRVSKDDLKDIVDVMMLGGDCPADNPTCEPLEKIAREPQPMPALQPLADTLLPLMAAGGSGHIRYCRPSDIDAPASTDVSDCPGQRHSIGYAAVTNPVSDTEESIFMVVVDIPEEVFLGDINAFVQRAKFSAVILAVIVIVVSLVVARTLAKPIGHLSQVAQNVENDEPFEPDDIAEVTVLGDEVGRLARVFSSMVLALRARMAELRTIYEIGSKISDNVDLPDTLSDIIASLGDVIDFDAAEICLYDLQNNALELYLTNTEIVSDDETIEKTTYDSEKDYFPLLFGGRQGVMINDIAGYTGHKLSTDRSWDAFEPKSYLGVSLGNQDRVVGTIEMISSRMNGFSEDNKRILESISIQAAVAISKAQEVKDRERRLVNMDIVLDESRTNEEVEKVTSSEFFENLKANLNKRRTQNK